MTEATNSNFIAVPSGLFTGPSENIGGSSAYHVDIKFVELHAAGDYETIVEMMDAIAEGYKRNGQRMEFCNEGVSGEVWNPDAPMEEKLELARRAIAAHNHSSSTGSMDFYIVNDNEENRFAEAARTDAREMQLVVPPGGRVEYGQADGYGNFVRVLDADGNEVFKMGHGDNSRPVPENFTVTPEMFATQNTTIAATPPNQNSWLGTPAAQQPPTGLPTEEQVTQNVQEQGAENTYNMFSGLFGDSAQQGGGGGIFMMLFMMIMMAMGKDVDEERAQTEEGRIEQLREADIQLNMERGVDVQSPSPTQPLPSAGDVPVSSAAAETSTPSSLSSLRLPSDLSANISAAEPASSSTVALQSLPRASSPSLQLS
jgi:hypothetical protein